MDQLPSALIATIMTKLDVASICCLASTSRTFHSYASQILSFVPNFHLLVSVVKSYLLVGNKLDYVPRFPDIALPVELLSKLLPVNPNLKSLKVDCNRLDDSAIELLVRPPLKELSLQNCIDFSGKLLSSIGNHSNNLRALYLGSVAEKRGRSVHISDLEDLLRGCKNLETLILMFDVSLFLRHNFAQVWSMASTKLTALEIGYISSVTVTELLSSHLGPHPSPNQTRPPVLPNIQKLCLSVDYITDAMVGKISRGLTSLTHLDLRDAPVMEPGVTFDLTNAGLQQINQHGKLKHLSLIRSQEFFNTYFKRVNDLGMLLLADRCSNIDTICLGGFCRVTDTGFKTLLHSCSQLHKLRLSRGMHLTDLVFHDISATSLSLTHVSLRWCSLVTNLSVAHLVSNMSLRVLELRHCRNLGDESLHAISTLRKLKILLLDGSDISDAGLVLLKGGVITSLVSLSVRGCKRVTDKGISALFDGTFRLELQELDLSNLPYLSEVGIFSLAKCHAPISHLRLRQCPRIGDTSVIALASMQVDEDRWHGNSLRVLDLYNCGGITQLAYRWLKKPYFPRLRWLGVTGSVNKNAIDDLARSRRFLNIASHGEELGTDQWDNSDGLYMHDFEDEGDELEQWLDQEEESADEEMAEASGIEEDNE